MRATTTAYLEEREGANGCQVLSPAKTDVPSALRDDDAGSGLLKPWVAVSCDVGHADSAGCETP